MKLITVAKEGNACNHWTHFLALNHSLAEVVTNEVSCWLSALPCLAGGGILSFSFSLACFAAMILSRFLLVKHY